MCQARCAAGSTPALVLADDGDQETRETIMSKCITGFERSAHQTKIHHLQPGDLVSPRHVGLANEGREVFERQTAAQIERIAIKAANAAIERREQRDGVMQRLAAFFDKIK